MKLTLIFILHLGQVKSYLYINENTKFRIMMNVYRHFKDKILNPIKSTINSHIQQQSIKQLLKLTETIYLGIFKKLKIKFLS